jgi:hypothetical protein
LIKLKPKPNRIQNQTIEYFKLWNIIKMTENYIIIFEDKVLRNFDYYLIKSVFIPNFYIFWKKMIKNLQNFWQMVFWFCQNKAEPTERLSQKPEPNQNQMISWIWNQTQPKPDPKRTKPKRTVATLLKI